MKIELQAALNYIEQLDLSYISQAMCATSYPLPRWTLADAKHCEQLYKNFLILIKKYPHDHLVPSRDIDEFWHNHILYTKNYHQDCLKIFGHYLHHEPASNEDDEADNLVNNYLKTKQYYFDTFGESLDLIERS